MSYSTKRGVFPPNRPNPSPVIELLIDRQPWGRRGASHFSFGNRTCRMLLACKNVLEHFLETEGATPEQHTKTVQGNEWFPVQISVKGFSNFEMQPNGITINRPYLEFSCSEAPNIGIGLQKAEGLLAVWNQLEAFANDVGMPPIGRPANSEEVFG